MGRCFANGQKIPDSKDAKVLLMRCFKTVCPAPQTLLL